MKTTREKLKSECLLLHHTFSKRHRRQGTCRSKATAKRSHCKTHRNLIRKSTINLHFPNKSLATTMKTKGGRTANALIQTLFIYKSSWAARYFICFKNVPCRSRYISHGNLLIVCKLASFAAMGLFRKHWKVWISNDFLKGSLQFFHSLSGFGAIKRWEKQLKCDFYKSVWKLRSVERRKVIFHHSLRSLDSKSVCFVNFTRHLVQTY